jgi:hypothetical protein
LGAMHPPTALPDRVVEPLGVADAATPCHPVDSPRPDSLLRACAVPVRDLAIEQIGGGGGADVWLVS